MCFQELHEEDDDIYELYNVTINLYGMSDNYSVERIILAIK
jgi:hypothetical protein